MDANPERGCGTKKGDSCYGEGPGSREGGTLRPWTWLLGDGHTDFIAVKVPARIMIEINPAATIITRGIERSPHPVLQEIDAYHDMLERTKRVGMADHVGADNYSPYSFVREVRLYGPSRRFPKSLAKVVAQKIWDNGPIPIMFTHNRMPVFDDHRHLERAVDILDACEGIDIDLDALRWAPTWEDPGWSQYTNTRSNGGDHILIPILRVIDAVENKWPLYQDSEAYSVAKNFFESVRFTEQAFGLAWLGKVTYTMPSEGELDESMTALQRDFSAKVVNFLDLNKESA